MVVCMVKLNDASCFGLFSLCLMSKKDLESKPGGVLSGKVGTGMCGPDRVPFLPLRFTNGPFFI